MRARNYLAATLVAGTVAAPAGAQALRGDGSITCGGSYVVESGDALSRIAKRAYGDPLLYQLLLDANRAVIGGDPGLISAGMVLAVPCVDITGRTLSAEEAAAAAASIEAVVKVEGPLTAAELETLFGPVALFPDAVLTPVLVATTAPLDVVRAGRFVDEGKGLADKERATLAAEQPWDDSVRELAAGFPDLVTRMSDNIDWTEQAGEAVLAQTDGVLDAIQVLRNKAQENGYLVSNDAQTVETVNDKIRIAPATPGVVYVPTYDGDVIYTTPATTPPVYHHDLHSDVVYVDDDDWDDALITGGIILGGAVILDEIFDDDDWNGWDGDDIDWDRGDITIDRDNVDIDIDRGDGIAAGDRVPVRDGAGDRIETGLDGAGRRESISDAANREVAREKIEGRKNAGVPPAKLGTSRPGSERKPAVTERRQSVAPDRPRAQGVQPGRPSGVRQPTRQRPSAGPARSGRSSSIRGGSARGGGPRR